MSLVAYKKPHVYAMMDAKIFGPFTSLLTKIFDTVFSHFILGVARSAFTVELIPPTLGSEEAGLVALTSNIWLEPEFSPGYFLSSV